MRVFSSVISARTFQLHKLPFILLIVIFVIAGCGQKDDRNGGQKQREQKVLLDFDGPLTAGALGRLGRGATSAVTFTLDGEAIVVGGDIGLFMYRAESLEPVWQIPSTVRILSLASSPNGAMVAAGAENGSVSIVSTGDGQLIEAAQASQAGESNGVYALAWSPAALGGDNTQLAAGFNDGGVIISSVAEPNNDDNGEPLINVIGSLERQSSGVTAMAYSPNGRILATGNRTGQINIWDANNLEWVGSLAGHELAHAVFTLDWSPDGKLLLSGARDGAVIVWDMTTFQSENILRDHQVDIKFVKFSPDGEYFVSISADGQLYEWNTSKLEGGYSFQQHIPPSVGMAWSPDWNRFVAAEANGDLEIWGREELPQIGQSRGVLLGHSAQNLRVSAVSWSPSGEYLAANLGEEVLIWDVSAREPVRRLSGHGTLVESLDWSPDGKKLASGDLDGRMIIWNTETGEQDLSFEGHSNSITALAWSPDGNQIASAGSLDDLIIIRDAGTGEVSQSLRGLGNGVWSLAWDADSQTIAGGTTRGEVLFWNLDSPLNDQPQKSLRRHLNWVSGLSFSPDGSWLASSGADNRVVLTELATERALTLAGHSGPVRSVDFSPDGRLLASGAQDSLVIIWDGSSPDQGREPLAVLSGHADGVNAVAWSPDGLTLASGSNDGTVMLWLAPKTAAEKS